MKQVKLSVFSHGWGIIGKCRGFFSSSKMLKLHAENTRITNEECGKAFHHCSGSQPDADLSSRSVHCLLGLVGLIVPASQDDMRCWHTASKEHRGVLPLLLLKTVRVGGISRDCPDPGLLNGC